jgi:hypothetical protein
VGRNVLAKKFSFLTALQQKRSPVLYVVAKYGMDNHELLSRTRQGLSAMKLDYGDSKSCARWEKLAKLHLALEKQIARVEKEQHPTAYEELTL